MLFKQKKTCIKVLLGGPQSQPASAGSTKRHDDDDDDEDVKERELKADVLLCAFEALGKAWPKNVDTQSKNV